MNRIILSIGLFCITTFVTGKENVVSTLIVPPPIKLSTICGFVMDDPYPMKRISVPVANARIELRTPVLTIQGTTDISLPLGTLIDSAITNSDGKFCFKTEPSGSYNVIITHPEYTTRQISLSATTDTTLNITLINKNAVSFISGTVTTTCMNTIGFCNPKPVPGCSVSINLSSSMLIESFVPVKVLTISAVTDAQGKYLLDKIPLTFNGENVDVIATKSSTSKIAVATLKNTDTTVVNFDNFPADLADDSSFHVSPAKPTSKDSILFRFFNANDCCCALYKNMSASVVDSIIDIYYSLDNSPCNVCGVCLENGKWADFKYKPFAPGKYYVYKSHSTYCPPGTMCPASMTAPEFLGTVVINTPTNVISPEKIMNCADAFTFTPTGSSVIINLAKTSFVTLKAYSINGALLCELYNSSLSAGFHNIKMNALGRMVPANSMIILKMNINGVTKAVKKVTAGEYLK